MPFNLERDALIASGLREENRIAKYHGKLGSLSKQFVAQGNMHSSVLIRARELFDWLWKDNSSRYLRQGNYRLNQVIDAQRKEGTSAVGNCQGLTLLYNCLLRRIGIKAKAVYLDNAFGKGPHVFTLLKTDNSTIDIENILPVGFDYKDHRSNPSRMIWSDRDLVADIYHSMGNELFEKGELLEAMQNYNKSLELNPLYERARLNKIILREKIKFMIILP